jgi:hypothetical protein
VIKLGLIRATEVLWEERMRLSVSVSAVVAVAAAASITASVAAGSAGASTVAASAPRIVARTVQLITGDSVVESSVAGRSQVGVVQRSHRGIAGQYTTYRSGTDEYVVPGAARRYVGTVLDLSLFDVTALAKHDDTGRFAVTVGLAAGKSPVVPGLTVTSRSASGERGYLTGSGARAFGAALAKQASADGRARRVPTSLFGGVTRIAPAGVVVAAPVTPAFQQYTLQVKVIDPAGRPADFAFVILTNVDDGRKFTNLLPVVNGLANVSVPAGTYSAIAEYEVSGTTSATAYLVPVEQVQVTTSNQSMVVDTRTATTVPAVHTPRPASVLDESFEWDRFTAQSAVGVVSDYDSSFAVHVAPTGSVSKGRLEWVTSWSLAAIPETGAGYSYDLSFDDSGRVPANQHRVLGAAELARVNASYYADGGSRDTFFGRGAFYPFQFGFFASLFPLATPVARTEYVYAPRGARWAASLFAAPNDDDPFQGEVDDGDRAYSPGTSQTVDWLRGPLAPGIPAQTPGESFYSCYACRDAHNLMLFFAPYVDTTAGHAGTFDLLSDNQVAGRFQLYRNGTLIDNQVNSSGDSVKVSSAAATYRAVVTVHRAIAGFRTSTATTEDVTFQSSATSGPTAPAGWQCDKCTVLPVLAATVPLPTDLASRMPVGATPVTFTIGYNQQAAASSSIDQVSLATTTDGGASYHALPVTPLGHGRYRVTLVNSAGSVGHGVGIRIGASDSAGGKLIETVQDAYVVAPN